MASLAKEAYNRALYDHNHDEASYEQQEIIRSYAIGTDHQLDDDAVTVRKALYGNSAPKDRDAFTGYDAFMDDDFDTEFGLSCCVLPVSSSAINWAGNSSHLDRYGKRHYETYFNGKFGVLHIIDGHLVQLWNKGKLISEVDRALD